MNRSIVLIGPSLVGKSSVARLLAERTGMPLVRLAGWHDGHLLERYYREAGYSEAEERRLLDQHGLLATERYRRSFEPYAVERCLAEHPDHIVELGPSEIVHDKPALHERVARALAPHRVFLLLPSPDATETECVVRERLRSGFPAELNRHFVSHHSNHELAGYTVYTEGRTPEQTRDEIIALLEQNGTLDQDIVLIGPPMAGKSTVAMLLAARLDRPQASLDVVGGPYYDELGFDHEFAGQIREQWGFMGLYRYLKPFEAHATVRFLEEYSGVLDFGAGHSVYESRPLLEKVKAALTPERNVVLLLPLPDREASVQALERRPRFTLEGQDGLVYLLRHPAYARLAKHTVYTEGKRPEQTADEILSAQSGGLQH
jgi:adenylate kinase family enzyme